MLGPSIDAIGIRRGVTDGGEAEPAVFGETANHVEHDSGLSDLIEMEPVPGDDVKQVL